MAKRNAKLNLTSKVARATVFALLFTLVLGVALSAIFYTDISDSSGSQTADATAGKYYTIDSSKRIIVSAAALDGTTFSLDETYGPYSTDAEKEAVRSYWTQVNCSKQDILGYDSTPVDVDGYGMKTKSDDVKNGYDNLSTYAYLSIVPEDGLTITKITVTTTYLYAKTSGDNGWSSADHSTKTTLSIVSGSSSVEVASVTASEYGNRSATKKNESTNTNSLSTNVNKNGVIQIRLTGTYYKEAGSSQKNQVTHVAQGKNISISIEGTYSLPGDGTNDNPYKLRNRSDFDFLSSAIAANNSSFISAIYSVEPNTANGQTAYSAGGREIKMLSTSFTPIGTDSYQFKGSIIGNNCTISGLVIPDQRYSGLFGNVGDGASISNLTVSGTGGGSSTNSHAILIGRATGKVSITNCTTQGSITAGIQVGGLVGFADSPTLTISGCKNEASVTGTSITTDSSGNTRSCVGGFVGYANATSTVTINGSSNSGTITGQRGVGGLVGFSYSSLTIGSTSACENSGTINGGMDVGGIVGYASEGTISNSTNKGVINGKSGADVSYSIVQFDAYPYNATDQAVSKVNDGSTSTKYYSEEKGSMSFVVQVTAGTAISGFAIANGDDTASQTNRMPKRIYIWASNTNNNYTTNITTGGGNYETPTTNGWTQIYTSENIGLGTTNYYRKNYTFTNVYSYTYYYIYVDNGTHGSGKLQFSEFDMLGTENVGGIVGRADATSDARVVVSGNSNTNSVTGGNNVGGIIGYSKYGNITVSATNSGAISGYTAVGGIFGRNYSASATGINVTADSDNEIKNSGKITSLGGDYIGGIGGYTQDAVFSGTIVNAGEISASGKQYVGGIAGYLFGSSLDSGSFDNRADVSGGQFTGGIAGQSNYGSLGESYNSGRVEGGDHTGGIIGQVTSVTTVVGSVSMRNTAVVKGGNYVGGIFGEWTLKYDKDSETLTIGTFESYGTTAGGSYVGGIVGNLNTSGEKLTGIFKVGHTYEKVNYAQTYEKDGETKSNTEIVSHIGAFGGGIFGYTSGGATITFKNGTLVVGELDAYEGNIAGSTRNTGVVLGGAVGANIDVTLDFSNCSTVPITSNIIGRTAQDVTINGTEYEGVGMLGGVIGFNSGTLNGTLKGKDGTNIISTSSIFNVVNGGYVGGIVGYNTGTITDCRSGVTTIGGNDYRANYTGGVIGYNSSANVSGIYANSNIYGYSQIGGYIGASAVEFEFSGLTYSKSINAWGSYVGAFVGYATQKTSFNNCTNSGTIVGTGNRVGGFIGEGTEVVFSGSNVNSGNVTGGSYSSLSVRSNGSYTGGFVGNASTAIGIDSDANLRSVGRVIGFADYVGGLFGYWKAEYTKTEDIGTLEFYGTVAGVNYVGGIAGYFDADSKNVGAKFVVGPTYNNTTYAAVGEVVAPVGSYGGGFFGYATGGSTVTFKDGTSFSGQLDACDNGLNLGFTSTGTVIGCAVGYNNNLTLDFSGCTITPINADIIGRTSISDFIEGKSGAFLGGVVGYNGGTVKGSNSIDLVKISGEFYACMSGNDGYVGGVVGYNTGTITNAKVGGTKAIGGNDTYLRAGYSGGIAGFNSGSVSGVYVNTTVYGGGHVGGYFGYTTSGVSNIYHTAIISGTGQYVGGIAGYAKGATFKSCYHKGAITGGTNVGGIVGGGTPMLQYCYVEVDDNNLLTGTTVGGGTPTLQYSYVEVDDSNLLTGTTVGGLSGETGGSYSYAWAFYYGSNAYGKCTVDFGRALRIEDGFKSTAHVYPQTTDTNWDIVTTTAVASFRITGLSVSNGNYLGLIKMTNAVTPATSNLEYAKPNSINSAANTDGSVTFEAVQYMGYDESSVQVSKRTISDATAITGGANGTNNFTYSGDNKVNKTNYQLLTGVKYNKATFTYTSGDAVNVTSGGYKYKIVICYDSTGTESTADNTVATPVLGQKLDVQGQAITAFDLTSADAIYCYNGPAYGMPNASIGSGYNITKFKTAGIGVLEYNDSYKTKFYIASSYFNKVIYNASSGSYTTVTVTHSSPSVSGGVLTNRLQENQWSQFLGSSNYTGTVKLNYTLIDSDFGIKSGKTRDNTWGSASNPFVISNWIYLQRLSDIVNGTMQPIDSVKGYSKATTVYSTASNIFYDGCYFEVTADITIPSDIIFNTIGGYAIGNATSYNKGVTSATSPTNTKVSYFGGNISSDSSSIRNISTGSHLVLTANRNYVGLFGYVYGASSKAGVKNIAVLGNVNASGGNYVGGVVGYAKNAVIDSCYVNASSSSKYSVGGNNYVGGLVGYLATNSELYSTGVSNGTIYNQYVTVNGLNYVGGYIGAIEQGAGYDAGGNTYVIGNNGSKVLRLVNNGTVNAAGGSYVGGLVGAIISNTSTNISKFAPEIARNLSNISGTNYIGGIVGKVEGSNVISLENAENSADSTWSYNGTYLGSTVITVAGTDYIGGIAGYLDAGNNLLTRVFSTATVSGGSYVGGLVGYAKGGSFVSCFVSEPGTNAVLASTDKVIASTQYAGGLVGSADGANVSFTECYVQGFNWSRVTSSSGGVVGYASSTVKFEDSWALYLVAGADYSSVSKNENGKYLLVDSTDTVNSANIYEMAIFAGLLSSTTQYKGSKSGTSYLGKGIIPVGITLPSVGTLSDTTTKAQIVFYDVSGTETATDNSFNAENDANSTSASMIYIYLGIDCESMSACRRQVVFNNVADYTNATAWANAYLSLTKPIQYRAGQYSAVNITLTNTTGPYEGTFQIKYIANYTISANGTLSGTAVFTSKYIEFSYEKDSEVAPLIINTMDDWTAFANSVRGTDGTYTGYVKLTNNIGTTSNPVTLPAGYNSTSDVNKYRFGGTFDGNGYTITVKLWASASDSYNEMGLFPQAAGATFKNLTIAGSVGVVTTDSNGNPTADSSASGNDIGAFVGIARGNLTFLNCKNQAFVSGGMGHNTGGLVGTAGNNNVTFIDCVNEGAVISAGNYGSKGSVTYGVGGIIGSSGKSSTSGTVTLESCRNAGAVASDANVGGIIGTTNVTCTIRNSANTGAITGTASVDDTCVGGIAGVGTKEGNLNIYACSNTGKIVAYGNKAGGILGADSEYTDVGSKVTEIYYCYNTGSVFTGTESPQTAPDIGVQAGGIIGTMTYVDIQYCYNVGTITANGLVMDGRIPHARVGGIGAYAGADAKIVLKNCYNVGLIVIGANCDTTLFSTGYNDCSYAAGIIGFIKDKPYDNSKVTVENNYSLKYQVHRLYKTKGSGTHPDGDGGFKGFDSYEWQTYAEYAQGCSYSGTIMPSLADFTAAYKSGSDERIIALTANLDYNSYTANDENNSTVAFGKTGSAEVMNTTGTKTYGGATTVTATGVNTGIEDGSLGGYIYAYGCLPQLACFALDTKNGLAMTSMGYGYDEVNERYVLQPAGGEYNPYIIKDGVDLMSITAITQAWDTHYDFDDAYIEFADSTNNLSGDICTYINMPTGETNLANAYKFANNGGTLTEGKSYHIYKYGAVVQQKKNYYETGTNSYTGSGQWKSRNAYYNGSSLTTGAGISTVNYYPVGMFGNSGNRTFKGTINGSLKTINENNIHQTDWDGTSKAEVRGLRLDRTIEHSTPIYAGLFAFIENATVANIKVSGSITGRAISSGGDVHVGVVGYAKGESVIDGMEAYGVTLQALNTTGASRTNAVGGIIGVAEPGVEQKLTIKNCIVSNANGITTTVTGFAPNIGGIIGIASSLNNAGASAEVVVENCNVKQGTLSTTGTHTLVGGIVGKCSDNGSLTVTGSSVGTIGNTTTSSSGYAVTIKGDYAIGGIAGNAVANSNSNMAFIDCTVYGDALIQRTGTASDSTYGTAIGGIVGFISNDSSAQSLFRGSLGFHGTIDASVASTAKVYNIGGAVGYMGTSAVFDSIDVHIYGKITTPSSGNNENIGGFAGYGAGGTLDGTFFVAPTLSCAAANYVGGFIGINAGNTAITRSSKVYTAKENGTTGEPVANGGGAIVGNYYVGGFVGGNTVSGDSGLYIGSKEFLGASYGSDGDFAIIDLYSSVDGKAYIGGFLGRNEGNLYGEYCDVLNSGKVGAGNTSKGTAQNSCVEIIGGVIGSNGASAKISFGSDATFQNNGQVGNSSHTTAYQQFVGGILGVNAGTFTNTGTLVNTGDVYGYQYVGGAIGMLISGNISGTLANGVSPDGQAFAADSDAFACATTTTGGAAVTACANVGGVIGVMLDSSSIVASTSATRLYNYGTVIATNAISNAGGIIGLMYGTIQGTSANQVVFSNYGKVVANSFAGGIIGIVDGLVDYASFTNYSASMTFNGDTAMGGAIGAIATGYGTSHYPQSSVDNGSIPSYTTNNKLTHVTNTHFAYQASEGSTDQVTVTANGTKAGSQSVNGVAYSGGLGGVIGIINASDISAEQYWSGNSYYVNGNVIGNGVNNVGGLVGEISGSKVVIDNMLVYNSAVSGKNNVGGIVGYNASGVTNKASIVNCFNVRGTITGTSNYGGIVGYANTGTYTDGSYWILPFDNDTLNKVDPDNISGTLSATFNVAGSGKAGYGEYIDQKSTFETLTSTDTKIETKSTVTGGKLYTDTNGTAVSSAVGMNTTLYYATTVTTTTSEYDGTTDSWTTTSSANTTYTAIGTPANTLNFSVNYMSAHPGEPSALGYDSWENLAKAYNSALIYNSALGYGSYGEAGNIVYSTGDIEHGFFYVYAEETAEKVGATISVDISGKELAQWNIIADTPVKGSISQSAITYNNGAIEVGHIYTKAQVPVGTGYYVYFYGTTPNPSDNDTESDYSALQIMGTGGYVYFDWDTNQYEKDSNGNDTTYGAVGNVLIYYKKTVMESGLVYSGNERYAPIDDMTYSTVKDETACTYNNSYYYFTATSAGSVNTATDAGTYDVKANIWFRDSAGNEITIGSVDSTVNAEYKWTINKRDLVLTDKTKTAVGVYDSTFSHYVEFTVENSVYGGDELLKLLSLTSEGATVSAVEKSLPDVGSATNKAHFSVANGGSSTDANDCGYTVVNGAYSKATSVQTYTYTVRVYFKNAGSHKVAIASNTGDIGKNYSLESANLTVQVNRRKLNITYTTSGSSPYTYNGGESYQGVTRINIGGSGNEGFIGSDASSVDFTITPTATVNGSSNSKLIEIGAKTVSGTSVYYDVKTTDAASYKVVIKMSSGSVSNNYTVSGSDSYSWTINKKSVSASGVTIKDTTVTYDGKAHYINSEGAGSGSGTNSQTVGKETITFKIDVTYSSSTGSSVATAVNVGTYTAKLESEDGTASGSGTVVRLSGCLSKLDVEDAINNYNISFTGATSGTAKLTIEPAQINITGWNVGTYVYTGSSKGPSVTTATVGGTTVTSGNISYSNNELKISNIFGKETVVLAASGFSNTYAGNYTAKVTDIKSASGSNAAGTTVAANYKLGTGLEKTYSIAKSKIAFTYTGTVGDKTYDGTSTYSDFGKSNYTISTSNYGSTNSNAISLSSADYMNGSVTVADTNIKTNTSAYSVRITASLNDTKNYEWASGNTYTTSATAHITPKALTITLNDSSDSVYKTFDNSDEYATVASNGTADVKSKSQRTGKGITVSGFIASGITLTASFREEDTKNRAEFDEYVNGIYKDADGNYSEGGSFNKMLEFALSSSDNSHKNYYISNVYHKGGSSSVLTGSISATDTTIYVLGSSTAITSNTSSTINGVRAYKSDLSIKITKYTAKANYSNTTQSYANADNTYNTDWLEVGGSLRVPSSWKLDVEVDVNNGWMGEDGHARYTKYTRIVGRSGSATLGATLSSSTGKDLCVTLRNQPTLVIGYFVVTDDGSYQVGSVSGLLIATEYYKGNFKDGTSGDDDKAYNFVVVPMSVPTGVELDTTTYPTTWEDFLEAYYAKYNKSYDITGHPQYKNYEALVNNEDYKGLELTVDYGDYFIEDENGNATQQYGYYYWQPIEVEMPTYTKFIQVNDFDMIVTKQDIQIINEAFGNNWGSGKTYLNNVILFKEGSVAILGDSVFTSDFNGTYNGAGYTINHLTILATVSSGENANIGMFAHTGTSSATDASGNTIKNESQVTSVNLRNANIQVYDLRTSGTLNVGGIVGYNQAVSALINCTFHGTITVYSGASVNAGGIIGKDEASVSDFTDGDVTVKDTPIYGGIVIATITVTASSANVGGIVGLAYDNAYANLVSVSEIYVYSAGTVNAGGLIGSVSSGTATVTGGFYLQNAVYSVNDGTYTAKTTSYGTAESYDDLYNGSKTNYNNGVIAGTATDKGTYDFITDILPQVGATEEGVSPRESMRLCDLIDVYVLKYEISSAETTIGEGSAKTYQKATTSQYVGTANGTTGNRIGIAHLQQLSLLYAFNYMHFSLNKDITAYTNYSLKTSPEAFTGSVNANGHLVNVRTRTSSGTVPVPFKQSSDNFNWITADSNE